MRIEQELGLPLPDTDFKSIRDEEDVPIEVDNAVARAVAENVAPPPPPQAADDEAARKEAEHEQRMRHSEEDHQQSLRQRDETAAADRKQRDLDKRQERSGKVYDQMTQDAQPEPATQSQ